MNALCHRDYSEAGASIGIAIFDDRLEVWSWGRLPGDLTPEKLRVLRAWLCREAKLPEPDFLERGGEVGVRFWSATAGPGAEAEVPRWQREVLKALTFLGEGTVEQIRARIESPPTARAIQTVLGALVREGRVLRTGKARSTRYRLAG